MALQHCRKNVWPQEKVWSIGLFPKGVVCWSFPQSMFLTHNDWYFGGKISCQMKNIMQQTNHDWQKFIPKVKIFAKSEKASSFNTFDVKFERYHRTWIRRCQCWRLLELTVVWLSCLLTRASVHGAAYTVTLSFCWHKKSAGLQLGLDRHRKQLRGGWIQSEVHPWELVQNLPSSGPEHSTMTGILFADDVPMDFTLMDDMLTKCADMLCQLFWRGLDTLQHQCLKKGWGVPWTFVHVKCCPVKTCVFLFVFANTQVLRIPSMQQQQQQKSSCQHSFFYPAPAIWNQLPVSVSHSTSVISFKSSLKTFL